MSHIKWGIYVVFISMLSVIYVVRNIYGWQRKGFILGIHAIFVYTKITGCRDEMDINPY